MFATAFLASNSLHNCREAHVTTQRILNKFIEMNFSVGCMVWLWCCLIQDGLPLKLLIWSLNNKFWFKIWKNQDIGGLQYYICTAKVQRVSFVNLRCQWCQRNVNDFARLSRGRRAKLYNALFRGQSHLFTQWVEINQLCSGILKRAIFQTLW